ncbi:hypothetical protein ACFIOY_33820 [Bradyrhizobium sp. TZ2]
MTRLILTFDDSAAGGLKAARVADCVIPFGLTFVWGKVRSPGELDLLLSPRSARREASGAHWLDNLTGARLQAARSHGPGLIEFCERFEAVELWIDPEPNAQLQLIWLLDLFRPHANVTSRLSLIQMDFSIGDHLSNELAAWRLQAIPIGNTHLETASAAWAAWRSPTPEAWFDLLARDVSALPQLRNSIISLLEELPMRNTGLGATEMRMLELISADHIHPYDVFPGHKKFNERRVFGYWVVGALLDGLAHCPAPVVTGLDERPFDLEMHEDRHRHERYKRSGLRRPNLARPSWPKLTILAGTTRSIAGGAAPN